MTQLYRTLSSPNLRAANHNLLTRYDPHDHPQDIYDFDCDDIFYIVGDRVQVDGHRPGSVAYFGETEFGSGDWVGVVLDHPTGNHNGKIHGRQYFQCAPFHGLFVRPHRVSKISDHMDHSSRVSTPLEGFRGACGRWSKSPASSCMGSYFYDEDYKTPTVASLERKLKSIDRISPTHRIEPTQQNNTTTRLSREPSRGTSTPIGILKRRSSRPQSTDSTLGAKTEELARRLRASIPSSPSRPSVFNFRPKRAQLSEFGLNDSSACTTPPNEEKGRVSFTRELKKGDRVLVRTDKSEIPAVLRYMGETEFAIGEWAGVELDEPDGKNDGSVLGFRYFYCPQHYGLFVPISRVQKYLPKTSKADFKTMRSTIKSPPPPRTHSSYGSSYSESVSSPEKPPSKPSPYLYPHLLSSKRAYSSGSNSLNSPIDLQQVDKSTPSQSPSESTPSPLSANTSLLNHNYNYNESPRTFTEWTGRPSSFEADIDYQLKLSRLRSNQPKKIVSLNLEPIRPRSVKYTFQSSKYDGNPIAYRTVEYDNN